MASEIRLASGGTRVENQEPKMDNAAGSMSPIPATQPDPEKSEVRTNERAPAHQMLPPAKVPSTGGGEPAPSIGDLLDEEASSKGCAWSNLTVPLFCLSVFHFLAFRLALPGWTRLAPSPSQRPRGRRRQKARLRRRLRGDQRQKHRPRERPRKVHPRRRQRLRLIGNESKRMRLKVQVTLRYLGAATRQEPRKLRRRLGKSQGHQRWRLLLPDGIAPKLTPARPGIWLSVKTLRSTLPRTWSMQARRRTLGFASLMLAASHVLTCPDLSHTFQILSRPRSSRSPFWNIATRWLQMRTSRWKSIMIAANCGPFSSCSPWNDLQPLHGCGHHESTTLSTAFGNSTLSTALVPIHLVHSCGQGNET